MSAIATSPLAVHHDLPAFIQCQYSSVCNIKLDPNELQFISKSNFIHILQLYMIYRKNSHPRDYQRGSSLEWYWLYNAIQ